MNTQKLFLMAVAMAGLLASCKHDVDLYADFREIPVIYGVLDAEADTNYIKITRAFYAQGDAYQIAQNPDSSNYPGRLDARLTEFLNGSKTREIVLDTITIHNKQEGIFYAPDQKLYYTTERLNINALNKSYSYQLTVAFPHDTITAMCNIVGNAGFQAQSLAANFSKVYFGVRKKFLFKPATNGKLYQFHFSFTFLEQRTPDGDSVPRTMHWDLKDYYDEDLAADMMNESYVFGYYPRAFYETLYDFIGGDTAVEGLTRYITDYPVELTMTTCGHNLRTFIYMSGLENNAVSGEPDFALIDGCHGVFSSKISRKVPLRLAGETVPDLLAMTDYGFKFIGGEIPPDE